MTSTDNESPLDQALLWCVRLQDGDVSQAEREAFEQWLEADPANPPAWQRALQVWDNAGPAAAAFAESPPALAVSRASRPWRGWAVAATVLLALGLWNLSPAIWADYRTAVAQTATWQLADGSSIQLAPDTALDVRFTEGERRIHLYKGEAWFQVAANPSRPFVVEANDGSVRALGTAFDVKIEAQQVRVAVTEHAVRVEQRGQQVDVQEGQMLSFDRSGIGQPQATHLNQQLAWRQQRLAFKDAPLAQVVEGLQRYSSSRLLITDSALEGLKVTAAFDTRQPLAALSSLEVVLPIQVTTVGPWLTLIRADQQKNR